MTEPTLYELAHGLIDLHDRLAAVEARLPWVGTAADVAPQVVTTTTADGLSPVEPAPQAQQGVTVEELATTIACVFLRELPVTKEAITYKISVGLWNDPRIGPLLRGEGAPAAVPVVLPEEPPALAWRLLTHDFRYIQGRRAAWAEARAEVARQQGGQADG